MPLQQLVLGSLFVELGLQLTTFVSQFLVQFGLMPLLHVLDFLGLVLLLERPRLLVLACLVPGAFENSDSLGR